MSNSRTRRLTMTALMGAVSFVLMYFSFSVPILSPFAEFEASPLAELIGGYILGPTGAIGIICIKLVLKLIFKGTSSMFTGEIQNFLLSVSYVLPAIIYYRKNRTKMGAIMGLVIGSISSVIVAVITNIFIIFPTYMYLYGMNWDSIIQICTAVNPWIKDIPTMIAFSIIPFNIVSKVVMSFITVVVYKKISVPIKKLIA